MSASDTSRPMSFRRSIGRVFGFFFFLGRRTGRARVFFLLGLIPVVLAVLVRALTHGRSEDVTTVFNDILMVFYLQFYIVILSLFYGTSVTTEEIEARTLPYLVTRPLSKPGIVVGKFAAYTLLMFLMVVISLGLAFFILNSRRLGDPTVFLTFVGYAGVLLLGILAYTGLFTFLGTVLRRAILVGLVFGFGWENVIQYFPGSTQKFSIVHYLKSLLPHQYSPGGRFSLLLFRLEPTATTPAILMLALIAGGFIALAGWLFRKKEFLFEE